MRPPICTRRTARIGPLVTMTSYGSPFPYTRYENSIANGRRVSNPNSVDELPRTMPNKSAKCDPSDSRDAELRPLTYKNIIYNKGQLFLNDGRYRFHIFFPN